MTKLLRCGRYHSNPNLITSKLVLYHSPSSTETEIDQLLLNKFQALGVKAWLDKAGNAIAPIITPPPISTCNSSKNTTAPNPPRASPRTLTELKIYWQLLDWEKYPILIVYEEAKPQGFSQTFIDFLDRLDATICVITDSPHPTIPTTPRSAPNSNYYELGKTHYFRSSTHKFFSKLTNTPHHGYPYQQIQPFHFQ